MADNKSDKTTQVSERRFRRYNKLAERRRKQAQADSRFFRNVFSIAAIGTGFCLILIVLALAGGGVTGMEGMMEPWIGPVSMIEALSVIFILFVVALFFWRFRK